MTSAQAIARAQNATQAALAERHPASVIMTAPGEPAGATVRGGAFRGPQEWIDDDGIPRRDQALTFLGKKTAFPAGFDETAKGWLLEFQETTYRLQSVTSWGSHWLVRGVR